MLNARSVSPIPAKRRKLVFPEMEHEHQQGYRQELQREQGREPEEKQPNGTRTPAPASAQPRRSRQATVSPKPRLRLLAPKPPVGSRMEDSRDVYVVQARPFSVLQNPLNVNEVLNRQAESVNRGNGGDARNRVRWQGEEG